MIKTYVKWRFSSFVYLQEGILCMKNQPIRQTGQYNLIEGDIPFITQQLSFIEGSITKQGLVTLCKDSGGTSIKILWEKGVG